MSPEIMRNGQSNPPRNTPRAAPLRRISLPSLPARQVAAVLTVGHALASVGDSEQVLGEVIRAVCATVAAETGGFMHFDPERAELVLQKPAFGVHADAIIDAYRVPLTAGGNAARVFLSRELYITNDAAHDPRMIQRFIRLFKTRSTLTVPLVLGDRPIGVFHAINKQAPTDDATEFTAEDKEVLSVVAPLLASALQSIRMARAVEAERQKLERAMTIHSALTRTVVEAQGIQALCVTLGTLLSRPVLVLDALRRPLASHAWRALSSAAFEAVSRSLPVAGGVQQIAVPERKGISRELSAVAILLGARPAGFMLIAHEGLALDPIHCKAIEQAAAVFAIEILKERSAFEAERRVTGDLLADLFQEDCPAAAALSIVQRLGFAVHGPWRVVPFALVNDGIGEGALSNAQLRRA